MRYALFADVGSTFTKVTAVDLLEVKIIGRGMSPTTIDTDVNVGFDLALAQVRKSVPDITFDVSYACSSAAGGLKMIAIGLVPELTSQAALLAVQNAGAKVLASYSFMLSAKEIDEISMKAPDIVLLSGGTDGGNREVVVHNAHALAEARGNFTVIVAGNKNATEEACEIIAKSGKQAVPCANVMPEFGVLDIEHAREEIRKVFLAQIIHAKGLDTLAQRLDGEIIPTPAAVLAGITLLSKGTEKISGIGSLVAVDIGGATTDVYSATSGDCIYEGATLKGIRHPNFKRSVEGDLGMRWSSKAILDTVGAEYLAQLAEVSESDVENTIAKFAKNPEILPSCDMEVRVDLAVAKTATKIAVERHSGTLMSVYTPMGERYMQTGKDLSGVDYILGTGGVVISSPHYEDILKQGMYSDTNPYSLRPKNAKIVLDHSYILSSMGLLSTVNADAALQIMKNEILK